MMPLTILELNNQAKALLNANFTDIEVVGEILKITFHSSGHWYFTLTDEKKDHSVSCVMFKGNNSRLNFRPKEGDKVVVFGTLDLFVSNGSYQIGVKNMRPDGEGELDKQFQILKKKLENEGLFDISKKKQLPKFPTKIAIITSVGSAAYADINKMLLSRYKICKIYFYDCLVQGQSASKELISTLKKADEVGYDIIIMARGGGSVEDLWCFNDEMLARAIFEAKTPIVSAVGHESDWTLIDYVSDHRSLTPTASIIDSIPEQNLILQKMDIEQDKLLNFLRNLINKKNNALNDLKYKLKNNNLNIKILTFSSKIDKAKSEMRYKLNYLLSSKNQILDTKEVVFRTKKQYLDLSKDFVNVVKLDNIVSLDKLVSGDEVELVSLYEKKKAIIK